MKRTVAIPLAIFGVVAGALLLGMCCIGAGGVMWVVRQANQFADTRRLIDHTHEYTGRTITLNLTSDDPALLRDGATLDAIRGKPVRFYTYVQGGGKLTIWITFPHEIEVPKVQYFDPVNVRFRCEKGSLRDGNIAVAAWR